MALTPTNRFELLSLGCKLSHALSIRKSLSDSGRLVADGINTRYVSLTHHIIGSLHVAILLS